MQMTSSKLPNLFALRIAFFVWRLEFLVLLMTFVGPKCLLRRNVRSWIRPLILYSKLLRSVMLPLWGATALLNPRKMFPVILRSNLDHFKELWSGSLEFRDICRDLGLVPSEFGELVRVSSMRQREERACKFMRDELAETSLIKVFTLSYSETLEIPFLYE